MSASAPTPLEEPVAVRQSRRLFTIGLPKCINDLAERRFPLTPEGAGILVEQGFDVIMEQGAADTIHYTDTQYTAAGVRVATRREALGCDIVMHLAPMDPADIRRMRRGAMLLTLSSLRKLTQSYVRALLDHGVLAIAIDLIEDDRGNRPFADILAEIDGRAAMARAAALLADSVHGKGILLGGVAGIVPCEVTVIGAGIAGCAAARAAYGAGAMVRLFDHDVYRLRQAERELGGMVVSSALHPRVLAGALRSADVVVYAGVDPGMTVDSRQAEQMKRGVIVFDLTDCPGRAFASIPTIDLALASPLDISPDGPSRACYVNAGSAAARTAAMALSNTFITMLSQMSTCDGVTNALKLQPGLQHAALTFMGRPVNRTVALVAGVRLVDISIFLTLS